MNEDKLERFLKVVIMILGLCIIFIGAYLWKLYEPVEDEEESIVFYATPDTTHKPIRFYVDSLILWSGESIPMDEDTPYIFVSDTGRFRWAMKYPYASRYYPWKDVIFDSIKIE